MLPLTRMLGSSRECLARSMASLVTEESPFDWISSTAICGRGQDGAGLATQAVAGFQTPFCQQQKPARGNLSLCPRSPLPPEHTSQRKRCPPRCRQPSLKSQKRPMEPACHKTTVPLPPPEGACSHLRTPEGRSAGSAGLPTLCGPDCGVRAEGLREGRKALAQVAGRSRRRQASARPGAEGVLQSWLPASEGGSPEAR